MPLKVQQLPLPTVGLELYQLGVHIRVKNLSIIPSICIGEMLMSISDV